MKISTVPTWREQRALSFIASFHKQHGISPSMREIGDAIGLKSTSSIAYVLRRLELKGHITRLGKSPRAVALVKR